MHNRPHHITAVAPAVAPASTTSLRPSPGPRARRNAQALAVLLVGALLAACGGGGSDNSGPSVTSLTTDRLSYGRLSTFVASGSKLASAASFSATGCDNLTVLPGGSDAQISFTCTPNKALSVRVAARSSAGEVYNTTLAVPKPRVTLTTSLGVVVVELEPAKAPVTVDNFLAYAGAGFYNGTLFHRVVKDFVAQGGGYTAVAGNTLTPQTGLRAPIVLESNVGLSHLRGTIGMARGQDADTATSQFFFNAVDNLNLNYASASAPGYAVFGSIVSGQAVVDSMNGVSTRTVGVFGNVPVNNIVLQTAAQTL